MLLKGYTLFKVIVAQELLIYFLLLVSPYPLSIKSTKASPYHAPVLLLHLSQSVYAQYLFEVVYLLI